jgi:hypothetical protein
MLEAARVELIICQTCLEYFGLLDQVSLARCNASLISAPPCRARSRSSVSRDSLPAQGNPALPEDSIIKDDRTGFAGQPGAHQQRHQMFFSRVAVARGRGALPVQQGLPDKRVIRLGGASFNQPVLEGIVSWVGRGLGAPGEGLHIVERKPEPMKSTLPSSRLRRASPKRKCCSGSSPRMRES